MIYTTTNSPLVIVATLCSFTACFVLLMLVSRKFNQEQYDSSVRLVNAKAQFFESRAKNLEYQQSCTPTTDALELIAEALNKPTDLRIETTRRPTKSR